MHVKNLFPGKYLGAHHLNGRDAALTIERLAHEVIKTERGEEKRWVAYFVEVKAKDGEERKRLVLNRTNAETIAAMHGSETDNWIGKRITVYPDRVNAFGKTVDAIRIRATPPPPVKTAPTATETTTTDSNG